jgi:hypothetical protein
LPGRGESERERERNIRMAVIVGMCVCARRLQFPSPGAQHNITMPSAEWKKEHGILYKHLHIHTKNVTKKTMNKKVSHFGTWCSFSLPLLFLSVIENDALLLNVKRTKMEERKNYEKI